MIYDAREAFDASTRSDAFRMAQRNAGDTQGIYLGHPQVETFDAVL